MIVEKIALTIQAIELIYTAPPAVAALFCQSRLSKDRNFTWGTLENSNDLDQVISLVYQRGQ